KSLARRLGAVAADRLVYTHAGGNMPQWCVNRLSEMVTRGEVKAALIAGGAGYWSLMRERSQTEDKVTFEDEEADDPSSPDQIELDEIADNAPISIQLGFSLINLVSEDGGGALTSRVTGIRRQVSRALGFVIPPVRIRDDLTLDGNSYRIRVGSTIVGEDKVYTDRQLAIAGDESRVKLDGIAVKDPSFGMDAVWIMPQTVAEAEAHGYVVVNPESVMATHLSQVLHKYASQLIGQDDVQGLLDNLGQTAPHLVESVVPKLVPLHSLTAVLRVLLEEGVPISDLRSILEDLPPLAARNLGAIDTAEALRPRLAPLLIQQIAPLNQPLPVMTLDTELEHMLITMVRQSGEEGLILDNSLAEQLLRKISETSEKVSARGDQAVMVVSPAIRRQFAQLVRQHIEDLNVLAFTELPDSRKIEVVATISGEAG
ncbi:MAG: FHIPEP family type III secretion protein, partial [Pseudomonadota bacterium]|nr:FHIPEP family type III secretion protein [Pseudomonadota bacterium]